MARWRTPPEPSPEPRRVRGRVPRPRRPPAARRRKGGASLWIPVLVTAVVSTILAVPAGFLLLPLPPGADGLTLCLPGLGPVQRVADDVVGEHEDVVFTHEGVHAEQCRRLGPLRYASTVLDPRGNLRLEAEAFCAEIRLLSRRGAAPEPLLEETVRALTHGYGNGGRVPAIEVRRIVLETCTDPVRGPDRPGRFGGRAAD